MIDDLEEYTKIILLSNKKKISWVPVAHACNPADQEAKIKRIIVQSPAQQIVCKTLCRK
jgi:hypothetical protein